MVVHYIITCLCQWCHWCYCSHFHNVNFLGNKLNCLYALWPRPTYVCTHMWEWILNNNGTRFIVSFQPLDWGRLPSIYKYIKLQLTYSPLILLPQNKHWLHWDFLSVKNEAYLCVYTNRWQFSTLDKCLTSSGSSGGKMTCMWTAKINAHAKFL